MIKTDSTTGLPELPQGHFWRVKKSIGPFADVQLIKKVWIFNRVVEWTSLYRYELTPSEIRSCADFILRYKNPFGSRTGDTSLYGDYPPKKLNVSD